MLRKTPLMILLLITALSCDKDDCSPASQANAGDDRSVIGTTTTLEGNIPESGIGTWTIESGDGGSLTDPTNAASEFTGVLNTAYTLRWTISGCPESTDDVVITFICDPALTANAGPDQSVTGTSTTLAGNGAGTWSIVSGDGGQIAQPTSATSTFTGTVGTTYVLKWSVACPESSDEVQIAFVNPNPQLQSVDKTSVINGEIITFTGLKFSSNFNGASQINMIKVGDPSANQEVFLRILSRTETQIKAAMTGVGAGATGVHNARYFKKPDAAAGTLYPSNLSVTVTAPGANQFYTSSTFSANDVIKGGQASFGIKNGSLNAADYTIKIVYYDYTTGVATETSATGISIVAGGYGGSMDKITFTVPANLPNTSTHSVKITYGGSTLIGGWGSYLNVQ